MKIAFKIIKIMKNSFKILIPTSKVFRGWSRTAAIGHILTLSNCKFIQYTEILFRTKAFSENTQSLTLKECKF